MPGNLLKNPDKEKEPKDGELTTLLNQEPRETTTSSTDQIQLLRKPLNQVSLPTPMKPNSWNTLEVRLPLEELEEFLVLVRNSRLPMTTTLSPLMLGNSRRPCTTSELVSTINKLVKLSRSSIEMVLVRSHMMNSSDQLEEP